MILIALLVETGLVFFPARNSSAQSGLEGWEQPTNLSHSGAASQPRIVAGPDGQLQAFWLDQFDGLLSATYSGPASGGWSAPNRAPLLSPTFTAMPDILADQEGWVHAFWLEGGLMHSQLKIGTTAWSIAEKVADGVLAYSVSTPPGGGISLGYLTTLNTPDLPAGVYTIHKDRVDAGWGFARLVYASIYFRLLTPQQAWISILDEGSGSINLTWEDPRLGKAFFARSTDQGVTWSAPESLGVVEDQPVSPKVVKLPDDSLLRMWRASKQSGCRLYRQRQETNTDPDQGVVWENPTSMLDGVSTCPQGDHFYLQDGQLFWMWGEGAANLTIASWNTTNSQWSDPRDFGFDFYDSQSETQVSLSDLHFTMSGNSIAIAGVDVNSGEVWAATSVDNALGLVDAPSSPWRTLIRLPNQGQKTDLPSMAMGQQGQVHLVWSQSAGGTEGASLVYSIWDGEAASAPETVISGVAGEIAVQPALLLDSQEQLHLVWSGGKNGDIFYSHVSAKEAITPSAWSTPITLSSQGVAGFPQFGKDEAGNFYVLYVVRQNENRGVYLVTSTDRGNTWSQPVRIFNAAAAGWQMVDHPSLAVGASGVLHAVWVQSSLPGTWPPQGIFYSTSSDRGTTWSDPLAIAGAGYDWPRLAIAMQQLHLLYAGENGAGVWHRFTDLSQPTTQNTAWSFAARVPGWTSSLAPFAVVEDGIPPGGTLHLVGSDGTLEKPLYSFWTGSTWSRLEAFSPTSSNATGFGIAAATRPEGGLLAVAWLVSPGSSDSIVPEMYFITRAIPQVNVALEPVAEAPTPTPAPVETPLPTAVATDAPTPTPELNSIPTPPTDSATPPLVYGGGLAAVIVVAALVARRLVTGR